MVSNMSIPRTYTGPGLVDLQVNGYAGMDFNGQVGEWTAENLHMVRCAIRRRGVVMALPTLITAPADDMVARAAAWRRIIEADAELAAQFPALHIEGPFISPADGPRGTHPLAACRTFEAEPDLPERLWEASGGRIAILTLAPELAEATALIEWCTARGVTAALGHCQPSGQDIAEAVAAGASFCTHLGNGSHQQMPRLDNYIQHQLAQDALIGSFIADGQHMPFATLKNFIRAKTPGRSVLVTDAMVAAELPPGIYDWGGGKVEVNEAGRASRPGEVNLAGSVLTLDRAVINAARHADVTFERAWRMASTQPAAAANLPAPPSVTVEIGAGGFRLVEGG
jgi:N-acetylglucosamine-6-phosphate deacetylase